MRDEDAYTGPFNRTFAAPVLMGRTLQGPLTNVDGVVAACRRLPNSLLLSSDQSSHVAYGSGPCVTTAVDIYLLTARLRTKGEVCNDVPQPFAERLDDAGTSPGKADGSRVGRRAAREWTLSRLLRADGHPR